MCILQCYRFRRQLYRHVVACACIRSHGSGSACCDQKRLNFTHVHHTSCRFTVLVTANLWLVVSITDNLSVNGVNPSTSS